MNVLVTGGCGYVGSTLVPMLLAAGHRVRVLDSLNHGGEPLFGAWSHPAFEFLKGDIRSACDRNAAMAGIDAVVHLAAIVGDPACARDPETARAVNLDASRALLADARGANVRRFVFASTCSNYGRMAEADGWVDEESPLAPISLYAETKVAFELELLEAAAQGAICATPLRLATVYGVAPRMRFDLTVNEFTAELLLNGRLVVFGEQFWRPYVHVRDAARAFAAVLAADTSVVNGSVMNVGTCDQNYRKQDLIDLIRRHAPDATVEYVRRDEDPRDYRVRFTRIRDLLGFQRSRSVADGVAEVAHLIESGIVRDITPARYRN